MSFRKYIWALKTLGVLVLRANEGKSTAGQGRAIMFSGS